MAFSPLTNGKPVARIPSAKAIAFRKERAVVIAPIAISISPSSLFQRSWPLTIIAFSLAVTIAWTALLGYVFVSLISLGF
jgi:hypothetical protein